VAGRDPGGVVGLRLQHGGFFTRLIDTDVWTMLFWRGLFGGLFIAGYIVWRERADRSWPSGHRPPGLVAAAARRLPPSASSMRCARHGGRRPGDQRHGAFMTQGLPGRGRARRG